MSVKGYLGPDAANLIGTNVIKGANGKIIATSGGTDGQILQFDSNGDVVAGPATVNAFETANVLYVKNSNPGYGEFTSVAAALAAVTSPSSTNPWIIDIGPGIYTEPALTVPAYVQLKGEAASAVILEPTVTTTAFITGSAGGSISRLTVRGASGAGGIGVAFANGGSFDRFDVDNCVLRDCETLATVTGSSSTTVAAFRNTTLRGTFATGISVAASGGAGTQVLANGITYNQPAGPAASISVLKATGLCTLYVSDSIITQPGGVGITADDSARLFVSSTGFAGNATAISVPNTGAAPLVTVSGMLVRANTVDINIAHTTCTGSIMGSFTPTNSTIASPFVSVFAADPLDGVTFTGDVSFGPTFAEKTNYTEIFTKGPTMGLLTGGELSDGGGLDVDVAAGTGYYSSGDPIAYKTWTATSLTLADNSDLYIYYNASGTLTSASNLPDLSASILLGRVVTRAGAIFLIDQASMNANHAVNSNTTFFRKAIGPVFETGCLTSENATPLHLDVTSGVYYLANNKFEPSAGTDITWTIFYGAGGVSSASQSAINTAQYDVGGVLTAIPSNRWVKYILYVAGDGVDQKYLMVYPTVTYGSSAAAIVAPFATPPTWFRDNVTPIAGIVVQEGDTDITTAGTILDVRPRIGFSQATALSPSDHGALTGLADDDHTQYLLVDGTRQMAGSLNMGANAITAATTIGATGVITTTAASNQLVSSSGVNQLTINSGTSAAARTYTVPDNGTTSNFVVAAGGVAGEDAVWDSSGKLLSTLTGTAEINLVINTDGLTALDGSRTNDVGDWIDSGTGTTSTKTTTTSEIPLYPFKATAIKIANDGSSTGYTYMRMTLPPSLYNRKLKVQWEQMYSTGTAYVSGDYKVEVYTNAAADYSGAYTELTLSTDSSGTSSIPALNGRYMTTFDTSTAPYLELRIVRVAGTTNSFISLNNVVVGPGIQPQGAVVGAPLSYTPSSSQGLGTLGTSTLEHRRVGDLMHVSGKQVVGTPTGVEMRLGLPTGYTIGTKAGSSTTFVVGKWARNATGTGVKQGVVLATTGLTYLTFGIDDTANTSSPLTAQVGNLVIAPAETLLFDGEIIIPIAEWAGSGTVNLAQNDVEYASNSSTSNSADTTSFAYGPSGAAVPTITASGTSTSLIAKRVRFPTPIQATDVIQLQFQQSGTGEWRTTSDCGLVSTPLTQMNGCRYGSGFATFSSTDVDVYFAQGGAYPSGASLGSAGASWPVNASDRWRIIKAKAGQAVGFGAASDVSSGLLSYYKKETLSNTFTFNGSGGTSAASNMTIERIGSVVTIVIPGYSATTGTSSTTFTSQTVLPSWARPTNTLTFSPVSMTNNTAEAGPGYMTLTAAGTFTLSKTSTGTAWTNSTANCGFGGRHAYSFSIE